MECDYFQAACKAVQQARDMGFTKLEIRTDSQFMIDCECSFAFDYIIDIDSTTVVD